MNKDHQESPSRKQTDDLKNNSEVDQNGEKAEDHHAVDEQEENQAEVNQEEKKDGSTEISELEKLENDIASSKDKYLRLYSEFENYRRRTAKEKLDLIQTANENLLLVLLPILDDFERASTAIGDRKEDKTAQEGLTLIHNKLVQLLEQKGLKGMDDKKGTEFNAELHEAISRIPVEKKKLKGKVVDVVEKGYKLGDKVIRFAKVVIGS